MSTISIEEIKQKAKNYKIKNPEVIHTEALNIITQKLTTYNKFEALKAYADKNNGLIELKDIVVEVITDNSNKSFFGDADTKKYFGMSVVSQLEIKEKMNIGYGLALMDPKTDSNTPSYGECSVTWRAFFEEQKMIDNKLYKRVEVFRKDIEDIKGVDESFYTSIAVNSIIIVRMAIGDKITNNEVLDIFNNKESGIPAKEEIRNMSNNNIFNRISLITEKIGKSSGLKTYDEAHKILTTQKKSKIDFRELEYKGPRKRF